MNVHKIHMIVAEKENERSTFEQPMWLPGDRSSSHNAYHATIHELVSATIKQEKGGCTR